MVFGSIINSFTWRGLTLSFNIAYKFGYYFTKPALSYRGLFSFRRSPAEFAERWQKPGDEKITNVPSLTYPASDSRDAVYILSEIHILKGDHIRLQYVNLSYSINVIKNKLAPFHSISVYANAANLGIIWRANKQKLDPEFPNAVPPSRQFAFGIRSNF